MTLNLSSLSQRFSWPVLFHVVIYLLALVGFVQILGAITQQDVVQPFRNLRDFSPERMPLRHQYLTVSIADPDSPERHWQALQPTLSLLWAINPDIAVWLKQLNRHNRILWKTHPTLFNWPVLASYEWRLNYFYLGPRFWKLSEGDKAAVIAHEYFHYKQNKFWMVGDTVLETLTGKLPEYGSRTEDEAHLYQLYAYKAMEMAPGQIISNYFSRRANYRFLQHE